MAPLPCLGADARCRRRGVGALDRHPTSMNDVLCSPPPSGCSQSSAGGCPGGGGLKARRACGRVDGSDGMLNPNVELRCGAMQKGGRMHMEIARCRCEDARLTHGTDGRSPAAARVKPAIHPSTSNNSGGAWGLPVPSSSRVSLPPLKCSPTPSSLLSAGTH